MSLLTRKAYREAKNKHDEPEEDLVENDEVDTPAPKPVEQNEKKQKTVAAIDRFLNKAIILVLLLIVLVFALFFIR